MLFLLIFNDVYFLAFYVNKIICISDHAMKDVCLSFLLVPTLVVYGIRQLRYYRFCRYIPSFDRILNVFISNCEC